MRIAHVTHPADSELNLICKTLLAAVLAEFCAEDIGWGVGKTAVDVLATVMISVFKGGTTHIIG